MGSIENMFLIKLYYKDTENEQGRRGGGMRQVDGHESLPFVSLSLLPFLETRTTRD